jgi:hypothetical protein
MKYPSMTSSNDSLAKVEQLPAAEAEALDLLERGITLCDQWESLSAQQFAHLGGHKTASPATVEAEQLRLAEQFYELQLRWQQVSRVFGGHEPQFAPAPQPVEGWQATLRTRRFQFVAAVQRVFAANQRNAKAFQFLITLGAIYQPAPAAAPQPTYNQQGRLVGGDGSASTFDREG